MTPNLTAVASADARPASAATGAEIDLVFAIDPFHDAVTALGLAITAAEQALSAGSVPVAGARPAMTLVRGAAAVLKERATVFEQAAQALLSAQTAT
jgi:hypothetical protein